MDAQSCAGESTALLALATACVGTGRARLRRRPDGSGAVPNRLIEENFWRAIRHGLDGKLIDLERRRGDPGSRPRSSACWSGPLTRAPSWRSTSTSADLGVAARERQRRPAPVAPGQRGRRADARTSTPRPSPTPRDLRHGGRRDGGALRGGNQMTHEDEAIDGSRRSDDEGRARRARRSCGPSSRRSCGGSRSATCCSRPSSPSSTSAASASASPPGAEDMRDLDRRGSRSRACGRCCRCSRRRMPSRSGRSATRSPSFSSPTRSWPEADPPEATGAPGPQRPEQQPPRGRGRSGPAAPAASGCRRAAAADRDRRIAVRRRIGSDRYTAAAFGGFGPPAAPLPPRRRPVCAVRHLEAT